MGDPTVRLVDYGVGNLHSLHKSLELSGLGVEIADAGEDPGDVDGLVLPGVGAFTPAARTLEPVRDRVLDAIDDGLPLLGVCLGMQLLAEGSTEGPGEGLGLIEGQVHRLDHPRLPHIGWNTLEGPPGGPLSGLDGRHVYYVHSFALPEGAGDVVATTTYGERFPAILHRDNLLATQFHPEKSSSAGRIVLDAFAALVRGEELEEVDVA